jgi:hypothetical protein
MFVFSPLMVEPVPKPYWFWNSLGIYLVYRLVDVIRPNGHFAHTAGNLLGQRGRAVSERTAFRNAGKAVYL